MKLLILIASISSVLTADLNHVHHHNVETSNQQPSLVYQQPQQSNGNADIRQNQQGASLFVVNEQIQNAMKRLQEQQNAGVFFQQQGNTNKNIQNLQQQSGDLNEEIVKNVNQAINSQQTGSDSLSRFNFQENTNQIATPQQFYNPPSVETSQTSTLNVQDLTKPAQRPEQNLIQARPLPQVFEDPPIYQPPNTIQLADNNNDFNIPDFNRPQIEEQSENNGGINIPNLNAPQIEEQIENDGGFNVPNFNTPQIEEQVQNNNGFNVPDFNSPQIEEQLSLNNQFSDFNFGNPQIEEQPTQNNGFTIPNFNRPQVQLNEGNFISNSDEEISISTKPFPRPQSIKSTAVRSRKIDSSHCGPGLLADINGDCVEPQVSRNIFLYAAPQRQRSTNIPIVAPKPKLEYNIVFVRNPIGEERSKPIVIPPPQRKTLVYVLNKKIEDENAGLIESPAHPPLEPEVYFVNYDDGQNPELPGGVDLRTALQNMVLEGTVIEDFSNSDFSDLNSRNNQQIDNIQEIDVLVEESEDKQTPINEPEGYNYNSSN